MSYILDALRKADSERERGTVPTLHSHADHVHSGSKAGVPAAVWPAGVRLVLAAAAVLLLLVLGGLAARWWAAEPPAQPAESRTMAQPIEPRPAALAAPSVAQAPPPLTPTLLAPPPVVAEPLPAAKPMPAPQPGTSAQAPLPIAQGQPNAAGNIGNAAPPILKLSDLPEATRKALPALATSGAMYSDTPANRMLIVNGQLLHEGEQIAPELLLERIELKSAVLVFKGQRFRINF
jgi:general secretion pathway protein B